MPNGLHVLWRRVFGDVLTEPEMDQENKKATRLSDLTC